MLGKLMKHEFRYSLKLFCPIYIIYAVLAIVLKLMMTLSDGPLEEFAETIPFTMLSVMLVIGFCLGMFALMLVAVFGNVLRYHKNLYTDEGYLMNTLPVPSWNHIVCKLLSGLIWYAITCAVVAAGFFVAFTDIIDLLASIGFSLEEILTDNLTNTILSFVSSVISYSAFLLLCYMCEGIRSMTGTNMFVSILLAIGLLILNSIVITIITALFTAMEVSDSYYTLSYCIQIVYYSIVGAGLFVLTNLLLKHRLNLE